MLMTYNNDMLKLFWNALVDREKYKHHNDLSHLISKMHLIKKKCWIIHWISINQIV